MTTAVRPEDYADWARRYGVGPDGPHYTDWTQQYGPGSAFFNAQLSNFNALRDQYLGGVGQRAANIQGMPQPTGAIQSQQQGPGASPQWQDEDLVGAARFWGIPEEIARAMPRDQLISIVNERRAQTRPAEQTFAQGMGAAFTSIASIPSMFGVGAGEAITGGLQRLPIVGESLSRMQWLHEADMKLREMEENIRASTPESLQWLNSGANIAGNLATMFIPGEAAWAVAGKAAGVIGLTQKSLPIARAAFQGGASAWLLTGGSKEFQEHPGLSLAFGAGLGAAIPVGAQMWNAVRPVAEGLATRVMKSFVPASVLEQPAAADATGQYGLPFGMGPDQPPRPSQLGLDFQPFPPAEGAPPGAPGQIPLGLSQFPTLGPRESPQISLPFGAPLEPHTALDQLRTLAANGDEQAIFFLRQFEHGPATQEAENLAAQMNKAAAVIQSPEFSSISGQTQIDDLAAARASQATNPGGSSIIQGVSDPQAFVNQYGPHVRFARARSPYSDVPSNRLDALISDTPLTDEHVAQYERHGVYEGQSVMLPNGVHATVEGITPDGTARVMPVYGNVPAAVPVSELHPWQTSPGVTEVPQLWDHFQSYLDHRSAQVSQAMSGQVNPAQLNTLRQQNMGQYVEDFLTDIGVKNPADRQRITAYFNQRYVQSYKDLAPEVVIPAQVEQAAAFETPQLSTPTTRIDDLAVTKGMQAAPGTGTNWVVRTVPDADGNAVVMHFTSDEAAETWIRGLSRELPDITPPSDVPIEVAGQIPQTAQVPANPAPVEEAAIHAAIPEVDPTGSLTMQAAQARASGNLGRLQNIYQAGFSNLQPMRRFFSKITQGLFDHGMPGLSPAKDYDELSRLVTVLHNEQHPWMDRAADITNRIRTRWLHDGTFSRIYEIEGDAERMAAAAKAGFKPREIEAMNMMDKLWADLFPETGLDAARQIRRYLPHIAQRQSDPSTIGQAWENFPLTNVTQPWYEFMRSGNLNVRELNPAKLMDTYIRALTWRKIMAEPYAEIASRWKSVADAVPELAPVSNTFGNWMNIIRHGYDAQDDMALSMLHETLRTVMGPEVTKEQARHIFSLGLNATHSSFLGYRVHVMARDALQLLLAIPRAGSDLLGVLSRVSTDPAYRTDLMSRAVDEGAVALHSPRMSGISALGEFQQQAADIGENQAPGMSRRYTLASKVSEAVRDLMPTWLRDVRDTPLHPMYFYGKQSEFMRAATWEAGRIKAARAIAEYRAGGSQDIAQLMGDSGARTFDPAWQREFQTLVASGSDDKAASFLGRQLADATQFKYGTIEQPQIARSLTGRVAMQFGQYPTQLIQYMRESLVNGTAQDKAKFLGTLGLVSAGLYKASRATGWNFNPMNPFYGVSFTGGPLLTAGSGIATGVSTLMRGAQGQETGLTDENLASGSSAAGSFLNMFNPLRGAGTTISGVMEASQSPSPGNALGRLLITGQAGNQLDYDNALGPSANAAFLNSLQPMNDPMRAGQRGTTQIPSGGIPIYPPGMNTQSGGSPIGQAFNAAPTNGGIPGGQPYSGRPAAAIPPGQMPPPEVLAQLGVTDPSRAYFKGGKLVYDSQNVGPDGRVGTYFLDQAGQLLRPGQTWEQREQELMTAQRGTFHDTMPVTDMGALNTQIQNRAQALRQLAQSQGINLPVSETYRPQSRQDYLWAQGRNQTAFPGSNVSTWTLTSAHNSGMAIDFAVRPGSPEYNWLQQMAPKFGLVPMGAMDPGHVAGTDSSLAATPTFPGMPNTNPVGSPPSGGGGAYF